MSLLGVGMGINSVEETIGDLKGALRDVHMRLACQAAMMFVTDAPHLQYSHYCTFLPFGLTLQ